MAFFKGNYGSPLMSNQAAAMLVADQGAKEGQMYANMGAQVGGMIKEYGLNKQKRAELTGEIEAMLPQYMQELTMSGNEDSDKKNMLRIEKFKKGDSSMSDLKGLAGELAMKDKVQARIAQNEATEIANQTNKFNLGLAQELKDYQVSLAKDKSAISRLAANLAEETDPQKRKVVSAQLREQLADLGMRPKERKEREMQLRDAAGVRAAYPASVRVGDDRKITQLKIDAAEAMEKGFPASERARLEKEQIKSGIKYKDKYIDYLSGRVDTQIPGNVDIDKEISAVTKQIDDILRSSSLEKDDEGKTLKIEDLIEDVSVSGKITFSEDANKITGRELIRLEGLLKKKFQLQGEAKTFWIDGNGNRVEGTVAEREELIRKQRLKNAELERKQEEERIRKEKDFILKQDIG